MFYSLQQGKAFKTRIQSFFSEHPLLRSKFVPWSKTEKGRNILEGFKDACQRNFEFLIKEIQGISDGANIPFEEVCKMS